MYKFVVTEVAPSIKACLKEKGYEPDKNDKESVKTDETNLNDESDMKNQVKETKVTKTKLTEDFGNEFTNEITLDEIQAELAKYDTPEEGSFDGDNPNDEEIGGELSTGDEREIPAEDENETPDQEMYEKLVELRDQLTTAIETFSAEKGITDEPTGDEDGLGSNDLNMNDDMNDDDLPSDEEINELLTSNDEEIEESHGVSYSARRNNTGRHLPNANYLSKGELDQAPIQMQESTKKIKSLINENKNLTKQVNQYKQKNSEINETVEKFKVAIDKYRKQLTEMVVFNTNIANVNNILVNESLALTQEDKLNIVREFKSISTITESQAKYKTILNEMKSNKKNITELVEEKLNTVVNPSSKHKLDEVIEKTAYKNNEHIDKIKKLINYVERKKNL
jgi:uncharacterized coiled-coil DUF342 family protein